MKRIKESSYYLEDLEDTFADEQDIQKHILDIHALKDSGVLSKDLVLAILTDEEKRFIRKQLQLAFEAKSLIKDKEYAKYASDVLLLDVNSIAVLNRNTANNHLVKMVGEKGAPPPEVMPPDMDQQILDKVNKKMGTK